VFLGRALPWIVLLPFAVREGGRGMRWDAPAPARASTLCWAWLGGVILLFSAAPSRLEHYSLPALPAVSLLAARAWQRLRAGAVGGLGWAWLGAVAAVLLVVGAIGLLHGRILLAHVYWIEQVPLLLSLALPAACVMLLSGLILGWAVAVRRARGVAAGLAVLAVPMLAIVLRAQAAAEPFFSWRPLARAIAQLPPSVEVVFEAPEEYQQVGGLAFYTRRHITLLEPPGFTPPTYLASARDSIFLSRADFARRWSGADTLAFVSDPQQRRDRADGLVPGPFHVLVHSGDRWLLTNHPPALQPAG